MDRNGRLKGMERNKREKEAVGIRRAKEENVGGRGMGVHEY